MNYYCRKRCCFKLILITLVVLFTVPASRAGQTSMEAPCPDCVDVGTWSFGLNIGLGIRTNPLYDGRDIPLILLPQFSYYGERFFLENLDAGFTLLEAPKTQINILLTPSYDGVFFNRWDPGNVLFDFNAGGGVSASESPQPGGDELGTDEYEQQTVDEESSQGDVPELKTRRFSYMGGFEVSHEVPLGTLQLSFTREFTGRHSGSEARFAFQRELSGRVLGTVGFTWKDQVLTDYYYGVHKDEVADTRDHYKPADSFNPFVRLSATIGQRPRNWRFSVEYQKLDKAISNSPLVDKNHVISAFIGKQIKFR